MHSLHFIGIAYTVGDDHEARERGACGSADFAMSDYTRGGYRAAEGSVDLGCVLDISGDVELSGSVDLER